MKYNLGAGNKPIDGYMNLDNESCIYPLGVKDAEVIRASHVLEHFDKETSVCVLMDWVDCLAPGGVLRIAVPDFQDLVRRYQWGESLPFEDIIMGGQCDEYDYHKSIWTYDKLRFIMEAAGLIDIQSWQSEIADCAAYPFSLNLEGRKPCQ